MPHLGDFCVLRYDGRGQGKSPKPEEVYTLERQVGDLAVLLEDLGWSKTALVGISQGGSIALEFARRHPNAAVAVVAASCCGSVSPLLYAKLQAWLSAHDVGGPTHRFDVALPWIWAEQTLEKYPELVRFYRGRAGLQPDHVVRGLIQGAMQVAIPLEEVTCPVHFLVGDEDLLTPPFMMRRMHRRVRQSSFELVEGAHACLLECPGNFETSVVPAFKRWGYVG